MQLGLRPASPRAMSSRSSRGGAGCISRVVLALTTLLVVLCAAGLVSAQDAGEDPAAAAAHKQQLARRARYQSLAKSNGGVIKGSTQVFEDLLQGPRNYTFAVLLTALAPSFRCEPCKMFQPTWESIGSSWLKRKDDSHFFVTVDFNHGREVFQRLGQASAPSMRFYPSTTNGGNGAPIEYDFNQKSFDGDDLAEFLNQHGVPATYTKPFPWKSVGSLALTACVAAAAVVFLGPQIGFLTGSKIIWELVTLGTVIVMCSGYMWNQIRMPPYSGHGGDGRIEYIQRTFGSQYVAETQIVAGLYGLLAFSVVALTVFVPKQKDPARQRAGVYIWSAIFLGTMSWLFMVFRLKNGSYPFRLFL